MKMLRDPLFWLIALFVVLIFWLPYSQPLFAALFPQLPRPVYQQESFAALALAHFWLVGISSLFAVIIGTGAGIAVTRPWGAEFRPVSPGKSYGHVCGAGAVWNCRFFSGAFGIAFD